MAKARHPAAKTPEEQENLMMSLAVNLAQKQLEEGTASTAVITHYLKLATTREQLEKQRLEEENKLLRAKTAALEAAPDNSAAANNAIAALKAYRPTLDEWDDDTTV